MKKYEKPEVEITKLKSESIITSSGLADGKYNKNSLMEDSTGYNSIAEML